VGHEHPTPIKQTGPQTPPLDTPEGRSQPPKTNPKPTPQNQRPKTNPPPQVFHAGTATNAAGDVVANGGRVLGVTALGADVAEAQRRAYEGVGAVDWEDGFWRGDIGWRAVERLRAARR